MLDRTSKTMADESNQRQWGMINPEAVATLSGHTNSVYALTFLPDGRLASGSGDKTIKLWDVAGG
ncbi:MAG: hypothetical protein LRY69_01765, partial [Gammaproteobacteria bacterium]|nr:hypothetical protein [Gammaproteobacteria bacterium]